MNMEISVHFLRFRPTCVLVFPSDKSFVLSCNLLVHFSSLVSLTMTHRQRSNRNAKWLVFVSGIMYLLSTLYWAYSSWFLPKKPARTHANNFKVAYILFWYNFKPIETYRPTAVGYSRINGAWKLVKRTNNPATGELSNKHVYCN